MRKGIVHKGIVRKGIVQKGIVQKGIVHEKIGFESRAHSGSCDNYFEMVRYGFRASSSLFVPTGHLYSVLKTCLKRDFTVSNGIENDCISFRLEQIIEVLLRSTSVFQDGGQLLSVLRRALVIVQGPPEVASTAPTPLLYSGAKGRPRVEIQPEALKFLLEIWFQGWGNRNNVLCEHTDNSEKNGKLQHKRGRTPLYSNFG